MRALSERDSSVDRRGLVWVLGVFVTLHLSGALLSWYSVNRADDVPGVWMDTATGFLLLTLCWRGSAPIIDRRLVAMAAVVAGIPFVVHFALGEGLKAAAQIGGGLLFEAIVFTAVYRLLLDWWGGESQRDKRALITSTSSWYDAWSAEWRPRTPVALLALAVAGTIGAVVGAVWGVVPSLSVGNAPSIEVWLWITNVSTTGFIGGACMLMLMERPSVEVRGIRLLVLLCLCVLGVLALNLVLARDGLPLSWVLVIPSLLTGVLVRPWAAAFQSLSVAGASLIYANFQVYERLWQGAVPAEAIVEALVGASVLIALSFSLLQQERSQLFAQVRRERSEARHQAELFRTVMNGMTDGIIISDRAGAVTFRNPASEQLLGLDIANWSSSEWPEWVTVLTSDGRVISDTEALADLWAGRAEPLTHVQVVGADGQVSTIEVSLRSTVSDGEMQLILLMHDITQQLEREESMRNFAAVAAHDLKRPLTSLNGWVAMALDEVQDGSDVDRFLRRAAAGSARLSSIIDDWLGYSVLRDRQLTTERVPLEQIVRDAARILTDPETAAGDVSFSVNAPHDVIGDARLIQQVLANLLGNALKYRREGVAPSIRVHSQPHGEGWIRVDVSDNGIGVSRGEETDIFEMFHRSEAVATSYDGSGIGLAVCREIITRHGGRIWAVRNAKVGSTFSFTVPGGAARRRAGEERALRS